MELVTGGAFSGKLTYVKTKYAGEALLIVDLADNSACVPSVSSAEARTVITHLEALTRRLAEAGGGVEDVLRVLGEAAFGENTVIISREVGSGVVPVDPVERRFRELHGRVMSCLARKASRVVRTVCGIPEVLK